MKKLILCIVLLLCTISFSSADAIRTSRWPAGTDLTEFKNSLVGEGVYWEKHGEPAPEWYEGKMFFIETESTSYGSVKIVSIITLSSSNIIVKFDHNGTITYLPFNRILKIYEEK